MTFVHVSFWSEFDFLAAAGGCFWFHEFLPELALSEAEQEVGLFMVRFNWFLGKIQPKL